jgi:hypothetical protein
MIEFEGSLCGETLSLSETETANADNDGDVFPPPKTAMPGTKMFRRSDVLGRLRKWEAVFFRNLQQAEADENDAWRENQLYKLRVVKSLMNDVFDKCPIFENPAEVTETKRAFPHVEPEFNGANQ